MLEGGAQTGEISSIPCLTGSLGSLGVGLSRPAEEARTHALEVEDVGCSAGWRRFAASARHKIRSRAEARSDSPRRRVRMIPSLVDSLVEVDC